VVVVVLVDVVDVDVLVVEVVEVVVVEVVVLEVDVLDLVWGTVVVVAGCVEVTTTVIGRASVVSRPSD
jgi:hypothetical protein